MEYVECLRQNQHMQGFTSGGGFMYWSFTDSLVKTTMSGTMRAQTEVHGGHMGGLDYFDGRIYASFLGNALPGHAWEDWTAFRILVFDANDLRLIKSINLDICDYYKSITCTPGDTRGFQAIDGVAIAPDPKTGDERMFVACALYTGEKYSNQIILEFTLDGEYITEYHIPTGNTVFGIQNLDHDRTTGEFWFTTYGGSEPFMPRETLYCVKPDLSGVSRKYRFSTPYGFECIGNGEYYCSLQGGKNGDRYGIAYRTDESLFSANKSESEVNEFVMGMMNKK